MCIPLEYSCFPLQIPQLNETQPSDLVVDMRVQSGETVLKGNNTFPLTVSAPKASQIFLQTDRHTYKPGDVVKVRILLLNDDFLAGSEQKVSLQEQRCDSSFVSKSKLPKLLLPSRFFVAGFLD